MSIATIFCIGILAMILIVAGSVACISVFQVGKKHLPGPLAGLILAAGIILFILFIVFINQSKKAKQAQETTTGTEQAIVTAEAPEEEKKFLGGLFDKPKKDETPAEDTADQAASDTVPDEDTTDETSDEATSDESANPEEAEEELGWWAKTWNSTKDFFSGLFGGKSKKTADVPGNTTTEADLESAKEAGAQMAQVGLEVVEALQKQMEADVWQEAAERVRTFNEQVLANSYEYDPEEEKLPAVHIDNSTYREYQKLYAEEYARRGVRIEMSPYKEYIAELNGYACTDAPTFPIWSSDQGFYNQLSGAFPVTLPELEGVDLNRTKEWQPVVKQHEEAMKKEWESLDKLDRIDASLEEYFRDVYNAPEFGIEAYDFYQEIPLVVNSYPEEFEKMSELIDEAYSEEGKEEGDPVGIDYFLIYTDEEHAESGEDQYSRTTREYRENIAVPMISIMKQMKAEGFMTLQSSFNMCRPPVDRDSICRLIPADYQEKRQSLVLSWYGKNGKLIFRYGINVYDRRLELFAAAKPKPTPVTEKEPEPEKKKQQQQQQQQRSDDTPSETPPSGGGGGDNPPPPPPPPGDEPVKDPKKEPTQTGDGGDKGGGGNDDNRDGGDQDTGEARDEENEDRGNKDTGGGGGSSDNGNTDNGGDTGGSDGGDGNHDTGGDDSRIEDSGSQGGTTNTDNGDGTSTETSGNTGSNGGKDSSDGTVDDF